MAETGPVSFERGFIVPSHEAHLNSETPCVNYSALSRAQSDASALGSCPPHGAKSICGKRAQMEDTFTVLPNLLDVPVVPNIALPVFDKLPARIAPQLDGCSRSHTMQCAVAFHSASVPFMPDNSQIETLHFFGVYDGHGGIEAAQHCANRLHQNLCSVLAAGDFVCEPVQLDEHPLKHSEDKAAGQRPSSAETRSAQKHDGHPWQAPFCASFDVEEAVSPRHYDRSVSSSNSTSSNGSFDSSTLDDVLQAALKKAFVRTDDEFATAKSAALVGSTAIVALVSSRTIVIANCGDSRAVLRRGGKAVPLSDDHKPEREDEAARVEKLGGQVLFWNGPRVMGVLAMSRAIGDHCLRPYVIPEPEMSVVARCEQDEVLLLASDGLWDVMTNQEASDLAGRCLQRAGERGASRRAAARIAASVLARAAMDRGSKDNITVVVVDLKNLDNVPEHPDKTCAEAFKSSMSTPASAIQHLQGQGNTTLES